MIDYKKADTSMSNKKYKYHTSLSFVDVESGETFSFLTQLYQIGVYLIINNNPALQYNLAPSSIMKQEKHILKLFKNGSIKDLKLGRAITVIKNEDGFYVELLK